MCEINDGLEYFAPAYGTALVSQVKETGIYAYYKTKKPETLKRLEQQFGSFAPFFLGAKKGISSSEITLHFEIEEIFFTIINDCLESGIFKHYLNHGYGLHKLKAMKEEPKLHKQGIELWEYVTGKLIDIIGNKGEVRVGVGPLGEGYGNYDQVTIQGVSSSGIISGMHEKDFQKLREKNLGSLEGLRTAGVIMETGHNSKELMGLGQVCRSSGKQLITTLYANQNGKIPDIHGKQDIGEMFQFLSEKLGDTRLGGGLNCVSREVANDLLQQLQGSKPQLLEKFIALRPNSSPGCYNDDYSGMYAESLVEYLNQQKLKYPSLHYVTGCCGHSVNELQQCLKTC